MRTPTWTCWPTGSWPWWAKSCSRRTCRFGWGRIELRSAPSPDEFPATHLLLLAPRAVVRPPPADTRQRHRRAAARAGQPRALEDVAPVAGFALHAKQVALRAAQGYPAGQHFHDACVQPRQLSLRQRRRRPPRVNLRQPQAFVGVAVA